MTRLSYLKIKGPSLKALIKSYFASHLLTNITYNVKPTT
jgi:hypothetical protein